MGCDRLCSSARFDNSVFEVKENHPVTNEEGETLKRIGFANRVKNMRGKLWKRGQRGRKGREEQGTGLTYMRWEGLQGRKGLLRVGGFPFREKGLQA